MPRTLLHPLYLRPRDRTSATLRADDGAIEVGEQATAIVGGLG